MVEKISDCGMFDCRGGGFGVCYCNVSVWDNIFQVQKSQLRFRTFTLAIKISETDRGVILFKEYATMLLK